MNRVSRAVLARRLSAAIRDAACAGRGYWWSEQEAAHARACRPARAAAAAAAALTVCAGCSEVRRCGQRAAVDRYTGLAAGPSTSTACVGDQPRSSAGPHHLTWNRQDEGTRPTVSSDSRGPGR